MCVWESGWLTDLGGGLCVGCRVWAAGLGAVGEGSLVGRLRVGKV